MLSKSKFKSFLQFFFDLKAEEKKPTNLILQNSLKSIKKGFKLKQNKLQKHRLRIEFFSKNEK